MTNKISIDEAIKNIENTLKSVLKRQEATETVVRLLVYSLEKNGLIEQNFNAKIQELAALIEREGKPGADELSRWLRSIYNVDLSSAEIIEFPDKKS